MLTTIREGYFMINDIILGIKDLYKDCPGIIKL